MRGQEKDCGGNKGKYCYRYDSEITAHVETYHSTNATYVLYDRKDALADRPSPALLTR